MTGAPRPRNGAIVNARVWPMHGPTPSAAAQEAQAIAWKDGRILVVGSTLDIEALARREGLPVSDAGGAIVVPGFVDAHTHFLHVGVKKLRPDLRGSANRQECLARLEAWLKASPAPTAARAGVGRVDGPAAPSPGLAPTATPGLAPPAPVIGEGWDESLWPDRAWPTRVELDAVTARAGHAGRPVVLRRICGHIAVANSAAIPLVAARWPTEVDAATGVLLEKASLYLNEALPTPPEQLDDALQDACRTAWALGVTTVGDYSQAPYREALQRAAAAGKLGIRVASSIYPQQLEDEIARGFRTSKPAPGSAGAWLHDGGVKVFLDGSFGGRTAALREAYVDAEVGHRSTPEDHAGSRHGCVGHPHPNGTLNWSDADVRRLFATAHAAGIQVHAHAIGDAAIDQGLEVYEEVLRAGKSRERNPLRHRFEHYELVHDEQVATSARLGIVASCQPNFVGEWSAKGGMYEARLGERFALANRFVTFRKAGIPVAFGSDGMPFGALLGLHCAVHHTDPRESLVLREAVWHYTWMAAWSLHWEGEVGSLAVGKRADFVILEETGDAKQDVGLRVRLTYVDGVKVFGT